MSRPRAPMEPTPKAGPDLPLFHGSDYEPQRDGPRLESGLRHTIAVMEDGAWRLKPAIQRAILDAFRAHVTQESIGRYLRYARAMGWDVTKRHVGGGQWAYRFTRRRRGGRPC